MLVVRAAVVWIGRTVSAAVGHVAFNTLPTPGGRQNCGQSFGRSKDMAGTLVVAYHMYYQH